jgi:preprotein translocase subunit SecY
METLLTKLSLVFKDASLRKRLFFVLAMLAVFRLLAGIPIPGVDPARLAQLFTNNQLVGLLNIFSGGGLSHLSIIMLGVSPYITASIIMQLLTVLSPKLKQLYMEEGEAGRKRFGQYSRILTLPLALIQGFGFLVLLERQGVIAHLTQFDLILNLIVITAGSVMLMWLGELITEFGIGNGVSLIIFAGIVSRLPSTISQLAFSFDPSQIPVYLAFVVIAVVIIAAVVTVTEAERPVPVTYAKRVRGSKVYGGISTYLPLRVNQAGVIPIIFALSLLLFPQMIFNFLTQASNSILNKIGTVGASGLSNQWIYGGLYFILVFAFTYFYTAVTFDPDSISSNLQKNGAFVPGVRPGPSTSTYLSKILVRITFLGALFLAFIAILPLVLRGATGIQSLALGGTALLIVVSVVLDLIRKVDAQISMREY